MKTILILLTFVSLGFAQPEKPIRVECREKGLYALIANTANAPPEVDGRSWYIVVPEVWGNKEIPYGLVIPANDSMLLNTITDTPSATLLHIRLLGYAEHDYVLYYPNKALCFFKGFTKTIKR